MHRVADREVSYGVVAKTKAEYKNIVAGAALPAVISRCADQDILASAAFDHVVASAAVEDATIVVADDSVVGETADDMIDVCEPYQSEIRVERDTRCRIEHDERVRCRRRDIERV